MTLHFWARNISETRCSRTKPDFEIPATTLERSIIVRSLAVQRLKLAVSARSRSVQNVLQRSVPKSAPAIRWVVVQDGSDAGLNQWPWSFSNTASETDNPSAEPIAESA